MKVTFFVLANATPYPLTFALDLAFVPNFGLKERQIIE